MNIYRMNRLIEHVGWSIVEVGGGILASSIVVQKGPRSKVLNGILEWTAFLGTIAVVEYFREPMLGTIRPAQELFVVDDPGNIDDQEIGS